MQLFRFRIFKPDLFRLIIPFLYLFIIPAFLHGKTIWNTEGRSDSHKHTNDSLSECSTDSIILLAKKYLGTPYRKKMPGGFRFDCAGFVSFLYFQFGYTLPHSSAAIAEYGDLIDLKNIRNGDLLFFKGRSLKGKRIGHVSMVTEVNGDSIFMIHETSRGVVIDDLHDSEYYQARFIKVKRMKCD